MNTYDPADGGLGAVAATRVTVPALLAALTAAGAVLAVPLPQLPVPFTLQTFFVLLSGAVAGPRDGAIAMLAYIALGAAGVPVFSMMRGGLGVLLGPSGGYLLAFPLVPLVVGGLAGPSKNAGFARTLGSMVLGTAVIYASATVRIAHLTGRPALAVLPAVVLPFVPGDLIKAAAASLLARKVLPVLSARRSR
ncbi:MAG: biotin transporter BioY [Firmicutes bacterium]|nr:biotin transporter BioY [Bacillota bacterium]